MAKPKHTKPKHVPMRTCIGTGEQHPKRDMVRLVLAEDGHVVVDPTGKKGHSRGAYVSKSYAAAEQAVKRKRLQAEFERQIAQEDLDAILAYFKQFDAQSSAARSAMTD